MDYKTIVINTFGEFLFSLNFIKPEGLKNEVVFQSNQIIIRFIYHEYAQQCYYFIRLKNDKIEYENFIVEEYLKIKHEPVFGTNILDAKIEHIAKSQLAYFKIYKEKLLMGDKEFYSGLRQFFENRIREYNNKIVK